jgi:lipopolysaccharide transport system ATP-binding protein
MSETVIRVENLSKKYQLGTIGTGALTKDLNLWWHKMRGKQNPYSTIGENGDFEDISEHWALRDVSFEIKQGDAVGIIGKNGAGKSTLLKILSRITTPTKGNVKIKGRVASLLEVGTGFSGELSGKENIYINGAILGMSKAYINSKMDEIIAFSGVEKYIDTPVKRYSSGMYVRLAFAVAAHLEPEILIVDEVLAVGDAEFQKKCLGKMNDVSAKEGRTVLFVSHNMLAIKSLCTKGVLLENGRSIFSGGIDTVINKYISQINLSSYEEINETFDGFTIKSIEVQNNGMKGNFEIEKELEIIVNVKSEKRFSLINVNLFFNTLEGSLIFATCSQAEIYEPGESIYKCIIPANTLNDNNYLIDVMVVENREKVILYLKEVISIAGIESKRDGSWLGKFPGLIRPLNYSWLKQTLN